MQVRENGEGRPHCTHLTIANILVMMTISYQDILQLWCLVIHTLLGTAAHTTIVHTDPISIAPEVCIAG